MESSNNKVPDRSALCGLISLFGVSLDPLVSHQRKGGKERAERDARTAKEGEGRKQRQKMMTPPSRF